jgi:hypothetical protein
VSVARRTRGLQNGTIASVLGRATGECSSWERCGLVVLGGNPAKADWIIFVPIVAVAIAIFIFGLAAAAIALLPRARRFDRERRAQRIAESKSPGRVPRNVAIVLAIVLIVGGGILSTIQ